MYVNASYTVQLSKEEHEFLWDKHTYLVMMLHDRNPTFVKRFAPAVFTGLDYDTAIKVKQVFGDTSDIQR